LLWPIAEQRRGTLGAVEGRAGVMLVGALLRAILVHRAGAASMEVSNGAFGSASPSTCSGANVRRVSAPEPGS
jgi:hypothetical protein